MGGRPSSVHRALQENRMQSFGGCFTRNLTVRRVSLAQCKRKEYRSKRSRTCLQVQAADGAVIGIDLGTSNSAVAVIKDGTPVIIPVEGGRHTLPSVITLGAEPDDTRIGIAAQHVASEDPLNSFYSVKRLIGRSYANCYRESGYLVYKLAEGDDGETLLWSPAREESFTTEEVSGMILKHLIKCAREYLGQEISGAVIAVPAHFDNVQRQATLRAAKIAGLEHAQLLQEPVAAAMAYGLQHNEEEEAILVFDLGGGTYDVSLLEGFEGIFEVLATGGDTRLGGDDWDKAIADWCMQKCRADLRMEIRGQPKLQHQLYESARLAKVQLSTETETVVHVPTSRNPRGQQGPILPITRRDLEDITKRLRSRLAPPLERLGRECHVEWVGEFPNSLPEGRSSHMTTPSKDKFAPKPRKISQVVLVGSATRIPSVREFVFKLTGVEPCNWVNPEECVALGAAIQAGILVGTLNGLEMTDGSFSVGQHGTQTGFQGLPVAAN